MAIQAKNINTDAYFNVLAQIPGVRAEDVADLRAKIEQGLGGGGLPESLSFYQGMGSGDGKIFLSRGSAADTRLHINAQGSITNEETGFKSGASPKFLSYFIGGIFGKGELVQSALSPIDVKIIDGAEKLYTCATAEGSLAACRSDQGAEILLSAKLDLDEAAKLQRQTQIDTLQRESEEMWVKAEQYYRQRTADDKRAFVFDQAPEISEVMKRYEIYRYYTGNSDVLSNAEMRRRKAVEMSGALLALEIESSNFNLYKEFDCRTDRESIPNSTRYKSIIGCSHGISAEIEKVKERAPKETGRVGGGFAESRADHAAERYR